MVKFDLTSSKSTLLLTILPRITPHGFRHTHASLLLEAGESVKVVQQRLGHENSKVTLDIYAHITNNAPKKTGQEFADMMAHQ